MRVAIALLVFLTTVRADDFSGTSDFALRAAIVAGVNELNHSITNGTRPAGMDGFLAGVDRPWSEMSRPFLVSRDMRFLNPRLVFVEAVAQQIGSIGSSSTPVVLVTQRKDEKWVVLCALPARNGF